jgi:hypothetical protein
MCNQGKTNRQCTYKVTMRRVRANIFCIEKQYVLHIRSVCVYSLRYPVGNAHSPYCYLLPLHFYNTFPHYLIKSTICGGKKLLDINFDGNICHSKKQWTRYDQLYLAVFMKKARYSCPILMNLEFSTYFFSINIQYELSWKSVRRETTSCSMQTDRQTDMTKLIVAFQNFANASKNVSNVPQTPNFDNAASQSYLMFWDSPTAKTFFGNFISSFLSVLHIPLTSCFLISSMCVLIKIANFDTETYNLDQRTEFQTNRCSSPKDGKPSAVTLNW